MNHHVLSLAVALLSLLAIAPDLTAQSPPNGRRLFAAVVLVRGSVVGGSTGGFGVFVRGLQDTSWTRATKSNVITFGLALFDNGRSRRYYMAAGNGVHRSTDGGKSWRILTSWRTEEILCVVPDPVDSATIYAATPFGVFKTVDDGATWERKMTGMKTWFIQRIIMDRRDRRVLYAATETDLYKTTNGGESWTPLESGCRELLVVLQHPASPNVIVVGGEDTGMRRSTDGGETWSNATGLEKATVYTLSASSDGADLYAAGWKTGIWRSTDAGASWGQVWRADGIEAFYSLLVDPADTRRIFAGTVGRGIYESIDHGVSWRYIGLTGAEVKQIEFYP